LTRPFINEDFALQNEPARRLYHEYAKNMPIIDYHCHLPPEEVAEDKRYSNIAEIWLHGDHYKWRAMRSDGVPEKYCTGDASDWEKFEMWARTMPHLLRNPLYHWTQLELKRYFGIDELLSPDTAEDIWNRCNKRIQQPDFSARSLMKQSNVVLICTTDDPVDDLQHHKKVAADDSFDVQMLPTWRPDAGMAVEEPERFGAWLKKMETASGVELKDYDALLEAFRKRHDYFHECGCRLSDHGLETAYAENYADSELRSIFSKARDGQAATGEEAAKFKSALLYELALLDHDKGWTQQFHFGPIRNNNSRLFEQKGRDIGFDSIGEFELARPLSKFLDRLDREDRLAKTIIYNINPSQNAVVATMIGNFQDGSIPGKIQMGSGWWFNDQMDGMERQMEDLSQMGLLSRFVGMLTDSRSFLSYTRHEYFRRILCNLVGDDMDKGLVPFDFELVGGMIRDISYNNAANYFGFDVPKYN
jgi:glucuronate isomerase